MAVTPNQAIRYDLLADAPNGEALGLGLAEDLEQHSVMRFTTPTDRTTRLSGVALVEGMTCFVQSLNRHEVYNGSGWQPLAYMGEWFKSFPRDPAHVTDNLTASTYNDLNTGTWTGAPAGDYTLDITWFLSGTAVNAGNVRVMVNGTNRSGDHKLDIVTTSVFLPYRLSYKFTHAVGDGDLDFVASHRPTATSIIENVGSKVTLTYHGRKVAP